MVISQTPEPSSFQRSIPKELLLSVYFQRHTIAHQFLDDTAGCRHRRRRVPPVVARASRCHDTARQEWLQKHCLFPLMAVHQVMT